MESHAFRSMIFEKSEIASWLRRIQQENREAAGARVLLSKIAEWCGISRPTLYLAMEREMSRVTQARLSQALVRVAQGDFFYARPQKGYAWEEVAAPPQKRNLVLRLELRPSAPPRLRVLPKGSWGPQ